MKTAKVMIVCLIFLLAGGCARDPSLDGQIVTLEDGRKFELDHRQFDAYLLRRVN